jgi:uncharacterized membrane protein YbhN (UPF0104 family)
MTLAAAHLICIALVIADLLSRVWRIQLFLRGMGSRVGFFDTLVVNSFGDAAAALTPMRLGGQPARVWGFTRKNVSATTTLVAMGMEVITMYPIIFVAGAVLAVAFAPEWWATSGPRMTQAITGLWPWLVGIVVLSVVAWLVGKRFAPKAASGFRQELRLTMEAVRRMPRWVLLASIPLTLVNLGTRVAILPVLVSTLPDPPPLGAVTMASFALLYSQLILPTPSGAGAVELGFQVGAAGDLHGDEGNLNAIWRLYTAVILIVLGIVLAGVTYGSELVTWMRKRNGRPSVES